MRKIKPVQEIDLFKIEGQFPVFLGFVLAFLGMVGLIYFFRLFPQEGYFPTTGIIILFVLLGTFLGRILHPLYHKLIFNLFKYLKVEDTEIIPEILPLTRREGVLLKLAPMVDLTLFSFIAIFLLPPFFLPLLCSFVGMNLWLSGKDLLDVIFMVNFTTKEEEISWTYRGFLLWKKDDQKSV